MTFNYADHLNAKDIREKLGNSIVSIPFEMRPSKIPSGLSKNEELNFFKREGWTESAKLSKHDVVRAMYYRRHRDDNGFLRDASPIVRAVSVYGIPGMNLFKAKTDSDWFVRYCYYKANRSDKDWKKDSNQDLVEMMRTLGRREYLQSK